MSPRRREFVIYYTERFVAVEKISHTPSGGWRITACMCNGAGGEKKIDSKVVEMLDVGKMVGKLRVL